MTVQRVARVSMVAEGLRDDIVRGALAPGTELCTMQLADGFGVSRSTVRGALRRLVLDGLLRRGPGHRTFVTVLSDQEVRDIYLARCALESRAVRHVIATAKSKVTAEELERFVELMAASDAAGDRDLARTYDLGFHTTLVAASGSARLQRLFSTVIAETRLAWGPRSAASVRPDRAEEHRWIASMIREERTNEALAALKEHFDDAVITLMSRERESARKDRP